MCSVDDRTNQIGYSVVAVHAMMMNSKMKYSLEITKLRMLHVYFRYDFTITKWYRDNELHNPSWPLENPNPHGHDWPDIKVAFQWRAMPERPSPNGTLIARVVYSDSSSTGSPFPVGDNQGHANIEFILERSIAIGPAAGGGGHGEWPHG